MSDTEHNSIKRSDVIAQLRKIPKPGSKVPSKYPKIYDNTKKDFPTDLKLYEYPVRRPDQGGLWNYYVAWNKKPPGAFRAIVDEDNFFWGVTYHASEERKRKRDVRLATLSL